MIERRISEKKVAKVERDTPRTCATVGGSVGRNTASGLIHPVSSHSFECDNPENLRHACTKVVMMVGREESPVILKMCRHIRVTSASHPRHIRVDACLSLPQMHFPSVYQQKI